MDTVRTLQDVCICVIAEHFEKIHLAFTKSNNKTIEEKMELLQKHYSYEICSELSRRDKLKPKYFNVVFSNLKIFDLPWIEKYSDTLTLENIFSYLPNLVKVNESGHNGDDILKCIAMYCPKIVDISVDTVTDDGIKYLCQGDYGRIPCPMLKNLHVHRSLVTSEVAKYFLQRIRSLERINFDINMGKILYSIHKNELNVLEDVSSYNLLCLNLLELSSESNYGDILKVCLTLCPRLEVLSCFISKEDHLHFFKTLSLKEVKLEFKNLHPQMKIDNFLKSKGSNITNLMISNCRISIPDLAVNCPKLAFLDVQNITPNNNSDLQPIFRCLTKCQFKFCNGDGSMNTALRFLLLSSPNLKALIFNNCSLSPEIKTTILECAQNNQLEEITFQEVSLDKRFLKGIFSSCPSLKYVAVSFSDLSYAEKLDLHYFALGLPNQPYVDMD